MRLSRVAPRVAQLVSDAGCDFSSKGSQHNDQPGRQLPKSQQSESENGEPEIRWLVNRASPHRVVKGREQESYHSRVDARRIIKAIVIPTMISTRVNPTGRRSSSFIAPAQPNVQV